MMHLRVYEFSNKNNQYFIKQKGVAKNYQRQRNRKRN